MRAAVFLLAFLAAGPVSAQVFRCGNTYSSSPCPGAKVVDTTPATSAGGEGSITTIYFCKGYKGTNFWSSKHCTTRGDNSDPGWQPPGSCSFCGPARPERAFSCPGHTLSCAHV